MFNFAPWLIGGTGAIALVVGGWLGFQAGELKGYSHGKNAGYERGQTECKREIDRINQEASRRVDDAQKAARDVEPVPDDDNSRVQLCAKDPACRAGSQRD